MITNIGNRHLALLMISAVRYALGRRTYIVSQTAELVRLYRAALNETELAIIVKDINAAKDLGDNCDAREWLELRDELAGAGPHKRPGTEEGNG